MHGEHTLLGQNVVHDGEDGLLDLACITGAADDHQMGLVVHQNGSLAMGAVNLGNALEAGGGDDGVILVEVLQLLSRGAAQKLVNEQILAGQLVNDAEGLGILGIGPGKAIENINLFILQVGNNLGENGVEFGLFDGAVYLAPGNVVMHGGSINDELVIGAAAGVLAGFDHQCAGIAESALAALQRMLGQLCGGQVAVDRAGVDDAQFFQSVGFHGRFLLLTNYG